MLRASDGSGRPAGFDESQSRPDFGGHHHARPTLWRSPSFILTSESLSHKPLGFRRVGPKRSSSMHVCSPSKLSIRAARDVPLRCIPRMRTPPCRSFVLPVGWGVEGRELPVTKTPLGNVRNQPRPAETPHADESMVIPRLSIEWPGGRLPEAGDLHSPSGACLHPSCQHRHEYFPSYPHKATAKQAAHRGDLVVCQGATSSESAGVTPRIVGTTAGDAFCPSVLTPLRA